MLKKFWIPVVLLLLIVFCVGVWLYVKRGNAIEQHTTDDLGVEYNKAYESYIKMHKWEYPDCTQTQMLESEANRHAQYEVDKDRHQHKLTVQNLKFERYLHESMKRIYRYTPTKLLREIRIFQRKLILIDVDSPDYSEQISKATEHFYHRRDHYIRNRMSRGERRRWLRRLRPATQKLDKIAVEMDKLEEQNPVEPKPGHTHEHSAELYIARHRLLYPDCTDHYSVHREAEQDTEWRIETKKWQEEYAAVSAEIEEIRKESDDYLKKMRETCKNLTDKQQKEKEDEIKKWQKAWRERIYAAQDKRSRLYGRKPVKPTRQHYH